jgi:RHS repeat-associated protein
MNRMAGSEVVDLVAGEVTITGYGYDGYGRRTIEEEAGREGMRVLYDGLSFEVIREGVVYGNGRLTTSGAMGAVLPGDRSWAEVRSRYVYVEKEGGVGRSSGGTSGAGGTGNNGERREGVVGRRSHGISVTLYGKGEAVGMNYYDTESYGGGRKYLGKDVMGSVWGVTDDYGVLGDRYEYDIFGEAYEGDLGGGMNLGYTGKPYDVVTGMYNYGYRDYKAEVARFTSEDPIRDGSNWYAYVNNDPVNWIDPWGLSASDKSTSKQQITPKSDFEQFNDFVKSQGVERNNANDPFIHEKIGDKWDDLPESIRNYEPGDPWGNLVDDLGLHGKNQRLDDGYHVTEEKNGEVRVHQDVHDPLNGLIETLQHFFGEVLNNPGNNYTDNFSDWRK